MDKEEAIHSDSGHMLTLCQSLVDERGTISLQQWYPSGSAGLGSRPESNMLKKLPKMLTGISQKFHLLCFSVLLLCLHYAPKLPKILSIVIENLK